MHPTAAHAIASALLDEYQRHQLVERGGRHSPGGGGAATADPDFLTELEYVELSSFNRGYDIAATRMVVTAAAAQLAIAPPAVLEFARQAAGDFPRMPLDGWAENVLPGTDGLRRIPSTMRKHYPSLDGALLRRADPPPTTASDAKARAPAPERRAVDPPPHLTALYKAHVATLVRAAPPGSDLSGFEAARRHRRRVLNEVTASDGLLSRPSWGRVNRQDVCTGRLLEGEDPAPDVHGPVREEHDILYLTTFPVSGTRPSMLEHATSTEEDFRAASTAQKLAAVQNLMPTATRRMIWVDAVPLPRPAGERSAAGDAAQQLAALGTWAMLRHLRVRIAVLSQLANRSWFVSVLMPSHVHRDIGFVSPDHFAADAAALDPFWAWEHLGDEVSPHKFRPVSELEAAIYLHANVMEATRTANAPAVFVRKLFGRHHCLVLFAAHPCNMDPLTYTADNFKTACDGHETIAREIEAMLRGAAPPIEEIPRLLRQRYGVSELADVYLSSRKLGEDGTLGSLRLLRGMEYQRQRAFDLDEMGESLARLAARRLLQTDDTEALRYYRPHAHKTFPSIIGDVISDIAAFSLATLARIEGELANGTLSSTSRQYGRLVEARASLEWQTRLAKLGVTTGTPRQFREAYQLRPIVRKAPGGQHRRRLAIGSSNTEALLYFSLHANGDKILRGQLASATDGRVQVRNEDGERGWISLKAPACPACEADGASKCVMRYEEALTSVLRRGRFQREEIAASVESWYNDIVGHRSRSARAGLVEQLENCVALVDDM